MRAKGAMYPTEGFAFAAFVTRTSRNFTIRILLWLQSY
jgi:hypothetical protein